MLRATFVLAFVTLLGAAEPDYFPLQVGNVWAYAPSRLGQAFTVEVVDTASVQDRTYYVTRGFPGGEVWLRMANDGTLYAWDPSAAREVVWAAFGATEGSTYNTGIGPCNAMAVIRSRAATADVPVGQFSYALAFDYPPANCADAGVTSELYLPYVGLLQRTETSIAGPVVYDLVYASLGGITFIAAPERSFTVSAVAPGSVRLTLRNARMQPLTLTFPTAQQYDVTLRNEKGEVVYQWSKGRAFAQVLGQMNVKLEKTWVIQLPVSDLPTGKYAIEAWLTTQPLDYRGQTTLELK